MQQDTGEYFPIRREVTVQDVKNHMEGKHTIGTYQVRADNTVKWGVLDFDKASQEQFAKAIAWELKQEGYNVLLEESGSLGHHHVWVLKECGFKEMREILLAKATKYGLVEGKDRNKGSKMSDAEWVEVQKENESKVEVFPKTKEPLLNDQVGFLVKIPYGMNRKAGRKSKFLDIYPATAQPIKKGLSQWF